jgi:hypothetical protein
LRPRNRKTANTREGEAGSLSGMVPESHRIVQDVRWALGDEMGHRGGHEACTDPAGASWSICPAVSRGARSRFQSAIRRPGFAIIRVKIRRNAHRLFGHRLACSSACESSEKSEKSPHRTPAFEAYRLRDRPARHCPVHSVHSLASPTGTEPPRRTGVDRCRRSVGRLDGISSILSDPMRRIGAISIRARLRVKMTPRTPRLP